MITKEQIPFIPAFAAYMYNEAPSGCWGSEAKMEAWIEARTAKAMEEQVEHQE